MLDRLLRWVDQLLCTHGHVVLRGGRTVRTSRGHVVTDPAWACVADVIHAQHGLAMLRPHGVLLTRDNPTDEWREVYPP